MNRSLKSTIIRIGLPVLFSVLALSLGVVFLSNAPVSAANGLDVAGLAANGLAAGRALDSDHLVVGINGSPLNLDPASDIDLNKMLIVRQIYDTLTNYDTAAAKLAPQLAESWSVSADGMTWTFNLRTDVTFHDGTPLDAAAVVYNFERWWDPLHEQHTGDFIYFEALFGGYKGSEDTLLAGVTAVSSYQVQLQLTRPNSLLPTLLTNPAFSIASPAALQNGDLNSMPVGSAAYTFVSQDIDNLHLSAFDDYWGSGPYIPNLTFTVIEDPADRVASLVAGDIQVAENLDEEALPLALNPNFQIIWRESVGTGYMGINQGSTPLSNDLVRQAIAHAVNVPALVAAHYSYGDEVAGQLVSPAVWGYNPALNGYDYDPDAAEALLASAGYGDGFPITLTYRTTYRSYLPDPAGAAAAIQADLLAVGIDAAVEGLDNDTFITRYYSGELDLFLIGWYVDYPHADSFYSILCQFQVASYGPFDHAFCGLLEDVEAEFDPQQQLSLYYQVGQQLYDDIPLLPIAHPREAVVLDASLAGFVPSLLGWEEFKDTFYAGAVQAVVASGSDTTLLYTDTLGSPTSVEVPAGAVTQTILLRLEPQAAAGLPQGSGSAGHSFDLSAIQDGETLPDFQFSQPVNITIHYAESDVGLLVESSLALYMWDGAAWVPAEQTCQPAGAVLLDTDANTLATEICHLSRFAMLADSYQVLFLPLISQ